MVKIFECEYLSDNLAICLYQNSDTMGLLFMTSKLKNTFVDLNFILVYGI